MLAPLQVIDTDDLQADLGPSVIGHWPTWTQPLTHLSHSLQLMEALKEQEEINFRLRQYMDKIILAILDHNPSILEIKH